MLSKYRKLEAKILGFNTTLKCRVEIRVSDNGTLVFVKNDEVLGEMTTEDFIRNDLPMIWNKLNLGEDDVKEPIY